MGFIKSLLKIVFAILPVVCIILLTVAIVILTVSVNPDIKWNEYNEEVYAGTGIYTYYFNTLWTSLDASSYESSRNSGQYMQILDVTKDSNNQLYHDETWKGPIRHDIYKAIGLSSGTLLLLIIALTVHLVTKEKLFTVIIKVFAVGTGIAGGYFALQATSNFRDRLVMAILPSANKPPDENGYYNPEKEQMKMGFNLAVYGAVATFIGCGLMILNIGLYVPFMEGKWIWKRNKEVVPDTENGKR